MTRPQPMRGVTSRPGRAAPVLIAGFPAGPWGTNCYVVATAPGAECVVIDPGMDATEGVASVVGSTGSSRSACW